MMAKSDVNGPNTNEVFAFLKKEKSGIFGTEMIKWNFTKVCPVTCTRTHTHTALHSLT